jgi:hypothetical protein
MRKLAKTGMGSLLLTSLLIPTDTITYAQSTEPEITVRSWDNYGYGVSVSVDKVHTLQAGKSEGSAVTTIEFEEMVPGTFLPGRKITFSLPTGITAEEAIKVSHDSDLTVETTTSAITIYVPVNRQERKYRLKATMRLIAGVGYQGDMEATIQGAGIPTRNVLIAHVTPAPVIRLETIPKPASLLLGKQYQTAPDLLFTEEVKGAFQKEGNADVTFYLPYKGIYFSELPTIKVEKGDLTIDPYSVRLLENKNEEYENAVTFKIKKESTQPSTIRVSNIKLTTNRMLPDGAYNLNIEGDIFSHALLTYESKNISQLLYGLINHSTGTSAANSKKSEILLMPGKSSYYEGKTEKQLSMAPYIKQNRMYVPVDFFVDALGIHKDNIIWDETAQMLTLFKDSKVIQLQAGSNIARFNQAKIPISTGIDRKDGKITVPLALMASLLGVSKKWDPSSGNVILNPS